MYYSQENDAHQSNNNPLWTISDAYSAYRIQSPTARAARFLVAGQAVAFVYSFEYVIVNNSCST
jgi:hypothetical protein